MEKIIIEGGRQLNGTVTISGAKNAALPITAASILTGGRHRFHRVPQLRDIETIRKIMSKMGVVFEEQDGVLSINSDNITEYEAPYDLVKTMRA